MASSMSPHRSPLGHVAGAGEPARPVLVIHSWWGLTTSFVDYAETLAARGFLVGCIDLYGGAIARSPEQARALRSAARAEPMYRTLIRGLRDLRDHPDAQPTRPALVGFSMGGHWAIWLAQRADVDAGALVVHYATRAVKLGRPVPTLAHFAAEDPFVTASGRRTMERSLATLGWPYESYDYAGTRHWFAESGEAAYDATAAAAALDRTVRLLAAT